MRVECFLDALTEGIKGVLDKFRARALFLDGLTTDSFNSSTDTPLLSPHDTGKKVANAAAQVLIVIVDDMDSIVISVLLNATCPCKVEAHHVGAEPFQGVERIHNSASRLRHLGAAQGPMGMGEDVSWQWEVESHEESGPVYAVEAYNVLADDVTVCRPASSLFLTWGPRISGLGHVVHQSVQPNVDRLRLVLGDPDAPG